MKKVEVFFGIRDGRSLIYITPTIYTQIKNSKFDERHYFTIEIQWVFFGIGVKISRVNKNVEPYPDIDFLREMMNCEKEMKAKC